MAGNNNVNVSSLLSTTANAVGSLLQNPTTEEKNTDSDRVAASTTTNAGNLVQASVAPTMPFKPDFKNKDDFLSMSYSPDTAPANPTKMVRLGTGTWESSHTRTREIFRISLPNTFWDNDGKPAYGQAGYFAAVRCGFHLQVQLNVNMGSAGALIVVYCPRTVFENWNSYRFNTFTNLPHVIMNAATTSQADLYIPYINHHNFARVGSDDLGYVFGYVWSRLTVPDGAPTSVDITVMGSLLDLEFQNPRVFQAVTNILEEGPKPKRRPSKFKWVREKIDIAEGPGSMNIANVLTTTGSQSTALVGERAYYDPRTAGAKCRVKDLIELAKMYSVVGPNDVTEPTSNVANGYFAWAATVAPGSSIYASGVWWEDCANQFLLSSCYTYWRGSMVMKLTVYASTFNKGRLRMAAFPNRPVQGSTELTGDNVNNGVYVICDLGLNNTFELTIPYTWANWMRPTRGPPAIYLRVDVLNRLTYNSASPNSIYCVLQARMGDDAKLFIPSSSPYTWQGEGMRSWGSEMDLLDPLDGPDDIKEAEEPAAEAVATSTNVEAAQGEGPAEAVGLRATENDGTLAQQVKPNQPMFLNFVKQNVDIFTVSHTKVDHIFGRAWFVTGYSYSNANLFQIEVNFPTTGHASLARFFAYFTGEVSFHITHTSSNGAFVQVAHTYFGQQSGVERVTASTLASSGSMIIPPNEAMSLCVPYYSEVPLRCVKTTGSSRRVSGLGTLFVKPAGVGSGQPSGRIEIFMSLRCPNFFFPVPAPKRATTRSTISNLRDINDPAQLEAIEYAQDPDAPLVLQTATTDPLWKLRRQAQDWFDLRQGFQSDLLLKAGDVESNPGPDFEVVVAPNTTVIIRFSGLSYNFFLLSPDCDFPQALSICEQADRDWIILALQLFHSRLGYRRDLLLQCGDVESNPGPDIELVFKPRGFYKHYGVRLGQNVYHLNSSDILQTAISGKATFIKEADDGKWTSAMVAPLDYFTEKYVNDLVGSKHIFSAGTNCETIAREIFPGVPGISQGKALGIIGTILLSAGLLSLLSVPFDYSSLVTVYNQSIEQDIGGLTLLSQRCMTFFSNTMVETLNNDLVKFIVKILVRILCYIVLYCHAPNMLTTMCLGTLLVLDITSCEVLSASTRALFQSLVDGDIKSLVGRIAESLHFSNSTEEQASEMVETVKFASDIVDLGLHTPHDQGLAKDFNEVSMSFRHIEWWLTTFKKLFNVLRGIFAPSMEQKAVRWIEQRAEKIAAVLDEASDILVLLKKPEKQRDKVVIKRYLEVLEMMKPIVSIFVKVAPSTRFASTVFRMYSELLKVNVRLPTNTNLTRVEPIGVWISGDPGQGKSFLTHALATKILKKTKLDGIFTNPTGSEFMDGYAGQAVHIIDDAGQHREEKDLALLCQCISSVPFTVPMADLSEKGTFYESKFVIATTNRPDFVTTVLSDSGALARRFPYKLKIRARAPYCKNGRLDVPKAMSVMPDGTCWEFSADGRDWCTISLDDLVDKIVQDYDDREQAMILWKRKLDLHDQSAFEDIEDTILSLERRFGQMAETIKSHLYRSSDELIDMVEDMFAPGETPFQCFERATPLFPARSPTQKAIDWVKKQALRLKDFCEENKGWIMFFSLLTSFLGILVLVYRHYRTSQPDPQEQRAYNPQTSPKKGGKLAKFPVSTLNFRNEAPYVAELDHCFAQTAYISSSTSNHVVHCAAMKENQILIHGHSSFYLQGEDDLTLHFKGATFPLTEGKVSAVTLNENKMDLIILKIDKFPICFKNYTKYYTTKIGEDSLLIWNSPNGRLAMPVTNVSLAGPLVTHEGTQTHRTYSYRVSTKRGMCGGLLVTRVDGAYKVLGMHIAGNGMIGMAAAVGFFQNSPEFRNEGVVVDKQPLAQPVFQPSHSALHPSPLMGLFDVKMGPAVLTPRDPRLEVAIPSVVKSAAEKYRVNIFNVDQALWVRVMDTFKSVYRQKFGITKNVSIPMAIQGTSKLASLDLSTSAGYKYSQLGLRKKDLVTLDPFWISQTLVTDVKQLLKEIYMGNVPKVLFAAYLKDELRKNEKVKMGKTRCIEACSVDYVVAYRVMMAELYEKIYQAQPQDLGLAVGMNPWVDWDAMMDALYQYNYGLDYSSYDGSLSDELMRSGVEILAYCHQDPEQIMVLHEPVINSTHCVLDEIWTVKGGMPSGAPCTTVLNSICNQLVCTYLALEQNKAVDVLPIVYGDDVIFSSSMPLDMGTFVQRAKECFGMEVTSSDKTAIPMLLEFQEIEFLKRKTKNFPTTTFRVGALNLETLEQHIMWMKNLDTFPEQLTSFCNELALHGKEVYQSYQDRLGPLLQQWGLFMDDYPVVIRRMVGYVFE